MLKLFQQNSSFPDEKKYICYVSTKGVLLRLKSTEKHFFFKLETPFCLSHVPVYTRGVSK